ncbi:MAG: (p)ppGpp synthetase, partial [Pseudomonadota bacterium]
FRQAINQVFSQNSAEAETDYTKAEQQHAKSDEIVVALVSATALGGIKEAYPNYFADSTEFLKHLLLIQSIDVRQKFTLL